MLEHVYMCAKHVQATNYCHWDMDCPDCQGAALKHCKYANRHDHSAIQQNRDVSGGWTDMLSLPFFLALGHNRCVNIHHSAGTQCVCKQACPECQVMVMRYGRHVINHALTRGHAGTQEACKQVCPCHKLVTSVHSRHRNRYVQATTEWLHEQACHNTV